MEFYEIVNNRRSIRDFTDEIISEDILKRIIEAAYKAPANDHFRDWHFVVITDKEIKRQVLEGVPKNLSIGCTGKSLGYLQFRRNLKRMVYLLQFLIQIQIDNLSVLQYRYIPDF